METVAQFDKNLRLILDRQKKSVQWLGRVTGIPAKTIYHWLNGQRPRDIVLVKKVSTVLNVSLEDLFFSKNLEAPSNLSTNISQTLATEEEIILTLKVRRKDNQLTAQVLPAPLARGSRNSH